MNNAEMEKLKPISLSEHHNLDTLNMGEFKFDIRIIMINIISFILLGFSFNPLSSYYFNISYFLYPIDIISFIFLIISSVISSYTIILTISKKINHSHILYSMLYYIIQFYIYHNKHVGSSFHDKSFIHFYIFLFLNIQNICIYYLCQMIRHFYDSYYEEKDDSFILYNDSAINIKHISILILLIIIIILLHTLLEIKKEKIFGCEDWDTGLNGTKIDNDDSKYSCHLKLPKGYCKMNFYKGYFDLTPINNRNCAIRDAKQEKKNFMKNLGENKNVDNLTKVFGFPFTNKDKKYSLKNQKDINSFGLLVNNDIFDLDKNNNDNLKPESILDFSENNVYKGKYGELKINLDYNKELSEKRKKLENSNSLYDNILMIYIDATSRAHFQRSFPKLSNFIKSYMSYDPLSEKKLKSYQFMKYHSFGAFTPVNILPMFYGSSMKSNKGIHNIKYFKENGFITGHVVDMCNKEQYDISFNDKDERQYEEWDHENVAYLCDGNYFEIDDPYPSDRGAFSTKQRCLYGHPVSYYMIEYLKKFWEKYNTNKKYFRIAFNYGHEKTGAVISNLDEPLYDIIFNFYEKGYLYNTALFIVSDHGNQNDGIYNIINTSEFELEKKYGLFFLLLYQNKNNIPDFSKNLINNQQIMLTPYDIHHTMLHILYGNKFNEAMKSDKGESVLNFIEPKERNCNKYDDWYKDFCGCS